MTPTFAALGDGSTLLRCKGLLFDLDGVLVDSDAVAVRHWRLWAAKHGLDAEAILAVHQGVPSVQTIAKFAPHLDAHAEAVAKEAVEADDLEGVVAIEGIRELLEALPGESWTVVTSGNRAMATRRLRATGLPLPPRMVTADDVTRGKPDPMPYQNGAKILGLDPHNCVVVEDSVAGVAAGKAAGASVIGIAAGKNPNELEKADWVIETAGSLAFREFEAQTGSKVLALTLPASLIHRSDRGK